ncbi:MAG: hypothetical protein REI64_06625 [Pedobacter sp.]|uniref:hypothetical protein n=1 Tax=Pedobacter sp. TaxID=1411316 RepID=UPI002808A60F|nr:hypothetical protein [Pedobacter sp.]MDQ8004459.1 hypothetical protein [Pedobacter sp.]
MTDNRNSFFYGVILFTGLLLLSLSGYSQQEEPKRVTVVVTAKEIAPQKEIIQVPADNLPKVVSKPAAKQKTKATEISEKSTIVKQRIKPTEKIVAETPKTTLRTKPKVEATKNIPVQKNKPVEETKIAQNKPVGVKETQKPAQQPIEDKKEIEKAKEETKLPDVNVTKTVTQVGDETITTIKAESDNKEVAKITHSSKVNSFSYIWIGAFLIVAGLVLGLLFGKPAFLISFVGVVFIVLGIVI